MPRSPLDESRLATIRRRMVEVLASPRGAWLASDQAVRFNDRLGCAWRTLGASVAHIHRADPNLQEIISRRCLAKRLKFVKAEWQLPFFKGSRRVDVCKACHVYDNYVLPKYTSEMKELRESLTGKLDQYWSGFEWRECQMSGFLNALATFIRDHEISHNDFRSTLEPAAVEQLKMHEALILDNLVGEDGWINVLGLFEDHWSLRDGVKSVLNAAVANPCSNFVYLWFDFGDRSY